jgi:hypothetical protein
MLRLRNTGGNFEVLPAVKIKILVVWVTEKFA